MKRCMGCMEVYDEKFEICPHCGYMEGTMPEEAIHMIPGTVLHERYIIGKVVGYGGFGVTYVAWDSQLEHKVAIKEYLPSEFSTRMPGKPELTIFNGDKSQQFSDGMKKFVEEARRLAKFQKEPGIVKIYDCFEENRTAYIIMEYLEGITLAEYIKEAGLIPTDVAIQMMMPIMTSLKAVHAEGIIHRDIAPDNIMISSNGEIKLIDFGAARYATTSHSRSLTVIIKPGYSPEEQYRSRGDQGPHTDVYAVGAVLYKMITGQTPPDSMERRAFFENGHKDILEPMHKFVKDIPENKENAILNAMNVRIEDRSADMDTFIQEVTSDEPIARRCGKIKKIDVLRWPLWLKITVPTAFVTVVTLLVLFITGVIGFNIHSPRDISIPDGMTRIPRVVSMAEIEAKETLEKKQLAYVVNGKRYDGQIAKDCILTQEASVGSVVPVNYQLGVVISSGAEQIEIPYLIGYTEEAGINELENLGFAYEIVNDYDSVIETGHICAQSIVGGEEADKGSMIILTVSQGRNPDIEYNFSGDKMPDITGMKFNDVIKVCEQYGIRIVVSGYDYSDNEEAMTVLEQKIKKGETIQSDSVVEIVMSKGKHIYKVCDVVYMEEEDAIAKLDRSGIKYDIEYREDENVAEGCIVSQSIVAGNVIDKDEVVTLVISLGPPKFDMIDVTGESEKDALGKLRELGLIVTSQYEYSKDIPVGTVFAQSVKKGEKVYKGYEIVITVCSDKELVKVPDVTGITYDEASKKLEEAGFKVNKNEIYDVDAAAGTVIGQTPGAATSQMVGSKILLTVSLGKEPVKVKLDANSGNVETDELTVYYTDTYGELPVPVRKNCTFAGWYTAKESGTKIDKDTVVNVNIGHTLYAHWNRNVVLVTFDFNDGVTSASTSPMFVGDKYSVEEPTRQFYEFTGWYTAKDGGTKVTADTEITNDKPHTIYATWKRKSVKVKYDAGKGTVIGDKEKIYELGDYYSEIEAERDGYSFAGWYTKENGGGDRIYSSTQVVNESAHTLYAFWSNSPVKISFNSNGGSSIENINVVYDREYGNLPVPVKKGYEFVGWYTEADGGSKITESSIVKAIDKQTLYAHWENSKYKIYFNSCGGTCNINNMTVTYDKAYGTLPTPTRTGYTFKGWFSEAGLTTQIYSTTIYKVAGNQTLYAKWEANNYTVSFNSNGGSACSNMTVTYDKTYGTLPTPTRKGYTFKGWFGEAGFTTQIYSTTAYKLTSDQTLYAKWDVNSYKVTFDPNGGSVSTTEKTYNFGSNYGTLPTPTRDYYTFNGWFTSASGGTQVYSATVMDSDYNTTLYAHWTQNPVSDWVLASSAPADAEIIDTKWTYYINIGKTVETTDPNYSEDGWTIASKTESWEETGRGRAYQGSVPSQFQFDTNFNIVNLGVTINSFKPNNILGYETSTSKRTTSLTAGYIYFHWVINCNYAYDGVNLNRTIAPRNMTWDNMAFSYFFAFFDTKAYPAAGKYYCCSTGIENYNCGELDSWFRSIEKSSTDGIYTPRFFRISVTYQDYVDYKKVYTYRLTQQVLRESNCDSEPPEGSGLYNVTKYVKYRAK